MRQKATDVLLDIVNMYSPTGNESKVSLYLKNAMYNLGYSASIDSVGNCIGRLGHGRPTVLLCGHMDTVTPELPIRIDSEVLYGRGSVDAKAPLAALIIAGKLAYDAGFPGSLIVVGSVCEEGDNRGVKELIKSNIRAEFAVFGEPTDTCSLSIGYRGCSVVEFTVSNDSGHSSVPWAFPNAVEKAYDYYCYLKTKTIELTQATIGFESLSVSIRQINGGENVGVLPRRCEMIIEFRLPPKIFTSDFHKWLNEKTMEYLANNSVEKIQYRILDEVDPIYNEKNNILVKAFSQIIYQTSGKTVKLLKKTGTSDMNYYGHAFKIPVITYGPGESRLSHTLDEKIWLVDYFTSIEIVKKSLLKLAELY
jgi:[amino group carrier protein]-lysine/ornithine hydrolase